MTILLEILCKNFFRSNTGKFFTFLTITTFPHNTALDRWKAVSTTLPKVFVAVRKVGANNQTNFSGWVFFHKKYSATKLFSRQTQFNLRTQVEKSLKNLGRNCSKYEKNDFSINFSNPQIFPGEMLIEVLTYPMKVCLPEVQILWSKSKNDQRIDIFSVVIFPQCVFLDTWIAVLPFLPKNFPGNQKIFAKNSTLFSKSVFFHKN